MTSDHIGPGSGVARDYYYFPGRRLWLRLWLCGAHRSGNARPPPPGSIGELKWDSGSGTYFGVDPKLDMIYILLEQTQNERGRITPCVQETGLRRVRHRQMNRYVKPSSGIFNTLPHALQCTASLSWRCSPQVGQANRTLCGVNSARARLKNSVDAENHDDDR
jgi:hypothetical protein